MIVPNHVPKRPDAVHRIAVVGEAPGADEELLGQPFVGHSGKLLRSVLESQNLTPDNLYIGNVCQHRPDGNDISNFDFTGPEIQSGLATLRDELALFRPNLCLLLGNTPLRAFHDLGEDANIGSWRGSLFWSSTFDTKCLVTLHPAYILRVFSDLPLLRIDVQKARRHSTTRDLVLPTRNFITRPSLEQVLSFIDRIRTERRTIYIDIEGWANNVGVTMLGIATNSEDCLVVPFWLDGTHYWDGDSEVTVWTAVAALLGDENVPKVLQNALYEYFVLHWKHRIVVRNIVDDTMLKHFELFPEMEKALEVQASIYTDQPYWKGERGVGGDRELVYNATDCVVTAECNATQETLLKPVNRAYEHYRFNVSLLPAINYMQLRGCRIDAARLDAHLTTTQKDIDHLQTELNNMVGRELNAKSTPDKQWFLYDFLGYKPYERYGKTTKEEVLHRYYQREHNPAVRLLIQLVAKRTRKSDINKLTTNTDGRLRCSYNLVGTNTGRLSSSESQALEPYFTKSGLLKWEGSGTNLQNQTKELRDVFVADAGFDFWEIDLEGADGWTVAADLAALGQPTMLDDYLAGIKPAKVLYLMLEAVEQGKEASTINNLPRAELARLTKAIIIPTTRDAEGRPGDWKYLCMKRVQHGCITAGHEVLTNEGWLPIEQLRPGQRIVTYDATSSIAQWDVPSKLTAYNYQGRLYTFKGTAYDLTVTHDHRMLFQTNKNYKVKTAAEVALYKTVNLPVSSKEYFGCVGTSEKFIKKLAAFHSDGYIQNGRVGFHLKRDRKISRLLDLFGPGKVINNADGTSFFFYDEPELINWGKKTDWSMLALTSGEMRMYLDETMHWDGSFQEGINHKRSAITTAEQERAEVLNTMAHLCGYGSQLTLNARVSGFGSLMHSVSLNQRVMADSASMNITQQETNGTPVYCVTVACGFFFVRRNGRIMITGNTNYGMEAEKLSATIFKDSDGLIDLSKKDASVYQYLYRLRYNPDVRQTWIERQLRDLGYIQTAAGFRRKFGAIRYGRPDPSVVRDALALEPQCNTTYVCNMALRNLWYDENNRTKRGSLFVEPLLQVHDALGGQWGQRYRDWAIDSLRGWFRNPLMIHGIEITIPFSGGYGPNWKDKTTSI